MTVRPSVQKVLRQVSALLIPVLAAFVLGAFVIRVAGENPLVAYRYLFIGAFGGLGRIAGTLLQATPIMIAGLGVCLAFRGGAFNIGAEGQLYMGGFAAAWVGFTFAGLPAIVHVPLGLLAAALAGGAWVLGPAFFRARYGTNEIVSTIILNYVAVLLTSYLTIFVFKREGGWAETPLIADSAKLPQLFSFSRLNVGFFIGIALIAIITYYLWHTPHGYEVRIRGINPDFAAYGGVNTSARLFQMMLASGIVAGLAGGIETLGVHHRFMDGFAPDFGFDGINAALLAGTHPIGTLLAAVFFGALRSGSLLMEVQTNVSREVITVIQAVIILFVSARIVVGKRKGETA